MLEPCVWMAANMVDHQGVHSWRHYAAWTRLIVSAGYGQWTSHRGKVLQCRPYCLYYGEYNEKAAMLGPLLLLRLPDSLSLTSMTMSFTFSFRGS